MAEKGGAGNQHIGPGIQQGGRVFRAGAPVHLDQRARDSGFGQQGAGRADFFIRLRNEGLAGKTGIDAHQQQEIQVRREPAGCGKIRAGVQGQPCLEAQLADFGQGALGMAVGLGVDDQQVGSDFLEVAQITGRFLNHQVHVKKKPAVRPQGLDQRGTESDVGHKGPVHHIQMQPGYTGGFQRGQFLGQTGKISGKQGWGKNHADILVWTERQRGGKFRAARPAGGAPPSAPV